MSGSYAPTTSVWTPHKIGDILILEYGKALKDYQGGNGKYPVFGTNGKIGATDNYLYDKPSIVIGRKGAYRGVHFADGPFSVIDTAFYTKNKTEDLSAEFLYHWFKCVDINSMDSGSAIPSTSRDEVYDLDISLPPFIEQQAIASVLGSLDDKIDLLHRQNKTLEAMADILFRQWFVEEALEGWEFVVLGNYVDCFNGVSYKSDDLNPSTTAMVTLKNFDRDGGFRLDGFKEFTGKYKEQHAVNQGDLVVAHTDITQDAAVIGNPVLVVPDPAYDKLVISMDLVKITPKYEWLSNEFLYLLMRTREFKQHCLGHSNGSTVLHLSKTAIPTYEFFMPPEGKIDEFTKLAKGLLGKKFENISQTRTLEKLRDTLLPKLMSGEIRVAS
jgi:type I restriction enzyme S subunit